MLVLGLALPAAWGEDPPKDQKDPTVKEQYDALVKEFSAKQREIIAKANKAKDKEQEELYDKYRSLGKDYADKFYKLAEADPRGAVGQDALFWVVQNGTGTPVHAKAGEKVKAFVADTPIKDVLAKLKGLRGAPVVILDAALARAEKDEKDPQAADLVAWVATNGYYLPTGKKAIERMLDKYPDHPGVEQVIGLMGRMGKESEGKLQAILEKNPHPKLKAAAALALGRARAEKMDAVADQPDEADKVVAQAEPYFTKAIDLYKDSPAQRRAAETELNALRHLRVGKEALDIKGPDLDGKEFKLSDYRGKVVLLDFWGNW